MYFLIRSGYCIGLSESKEELEQQRKDEDIITQIAEEKRADEIFTIDTEGNLIKK